MAEAPTGAGKPSPSRSEGISEQQEQAWRSQCCAFISFLSGCLRVPVRATATACVYFQRIFSQRSFNGFDPWIASVASLLVASKAEESPLKATDLIELIHSLRYPGGPALDHFDRNGEFQRLRDFVLQAEILVMEASDFTFSLDHPFAFVMAATRRLFGARVAEQTSKDLAYVAWLLALDSLRAPLSLAHSPADISVACVYLASIYLKKELPHNWLPKLQPNPNPDPFSNTPSRSLSLETVRCIACAVLEAGDADSPLVSYLRQQHPWKPHFEGRPYTVRSQPLWPQSPFAPPQELLPKGTLLMPAQTAPEFPAPPIPRLTLPVTRPALASQALAQSQPVSKPGAGAGAGPASTPGPAANGKGTSSSEGKPAPAPAPAQTEGKTQLKGEDKGGDKEGARTTTSKARSSSSKRKDTGSAKLKGVRSKSRSRSRSRSRNRSKGRGGSKTHTHKSRSGSRSRSRSGRDKGSRKSRSRSRSRHRVRPSSHSRSKSPGRSTRHRERSRGRASRRDQDKDRDRGSERTSTGKSSGASDRDRDRGRTRDRERERDTTPSASASGPRRRMRKDEFGRDVAS